MKILKLLFFAVVLFPFGAWGFQYDVTYHEGDVVHVAIDIVRDISVIEAVSREALYKNITKAVCSSDNCTVKFWLDKSLASTSSNIDPRQKKAMVAEYAMKEGNIIRIYHYKISNINDQVARASCLKEVFNKYCLGGDASTLPEPVSREQKEEIETLVYHENTIVKVFRKKIAEIFRLYTDMTWIKFQSLRSELESIYGSSQDLSYFPEYANSNESRSTAIRIGKAKASHLWRQKDWRIKLSWFENNSILIYQHDELKDAMSVFDKGEGY